MTLSTRKPATRSQSQSSKNALAENEPGGYAAGTPVHTKEGLVPIEKIKVGDWVLSKHESGEGERECKRVTKTFVHEERQVILVMYGGLQADGSKYYCDLVVTPEHPIWVQGKRWKDASELKVKWPALKLELTSSENANIVKNVRLFTTGNPNVAWLPISSLASDLNSRGQHLDISTMTRSEDFPFLEIDYVVKAKRAKPEHLFRTTVYNFEVEDFHTYYAGKAGVWVHNTGGHDGRFTTGQTIHVNGGAYLGG